MADEAVLSFLAGLAAGASRGYSGAKARSREEEEREKERKERLSEAAQNRLFQQVIATQAQQGAEKLEKSRQEHETTMAETERRAEESANREGEYRKSAQRDELIRAYLESVGAGGMTTTEGEFPYTTRTTAIDFSKLTPEQGLSVQSIMGGGAPMEMRPKEREYLDPKIAAMMDRQAILWDQYKYEPDQVRKVAIMSEINEIGKMIRGYMGIPESEISPSDIERPEGMDEQRIKMAKGWEEMYSGLGESRKGFIDWLLNWYKNKENPILGLSWPEEGKTYKESKHLTIIP